MSHKAFIYARTSCRNFKPIKIPATVIRDITEIAIDAPNGCCRQTVRYHITQDDENIKKIAPCIAGLTNFSNIQCLVSVSAESSFYSLIDKNLQYVDASLSAENFILGASLYGVYGTMCNFFHATENQIKICKEILHIPDSETIVMFIAMGYPTEIPEKPTRRNVESFYTVV